jgi:hypothetical protein
LLASLTLFLIASCPRVLLPSFFFCYVTLHARLHCQQMGTREKRV